MKKSTSASFYRRLLLGSAILLVTGFLVQLVFRNGQKESQPEKDREYTQQNSTPTNGIASIGGASPSLLTKPDPQWLLNLPEGGSNRSYAIDPSQIVVRKADGQQVVKEVVDASSLEDLERFFRVRKRVSEDEVAYLVLYPEEGPRTQYSRRLLGQKVAVELADNILASKLSKTVGARNWRAMEFFPGRFIFEAAHGMDTISLWRKLSKLTGVITARPLLSRPLVA